MYKTDPYSSEEFYPLRCNQRFAKSKNRIAFHNLNNNEFRRKLNVINKPLFKNLKILDELFLSNKTKNLNSLIFHKQFLLGRNYDFTKHTHYESYEGKNHTACYNYILIPLEKEKVKIIKTGEL
jgi:hypothetical protein